MNKFICQCNKHWNTNEHGGLLQDTHSSVGYWSNEATNPQNCPECEAMTDYDLPVWRWISAVEE